MSKVIFMNHYLGHKNNNLGIRIGCISGVSEIKFSESFKELERSIILIPAKEIITEDSLQSLIKHHLFDQVFNRCLFSFFIFFMLG